MNSIGRKEQNLTTEEYWSGAWNNFSLPQKINLNVKTLFLVDRVLKKNLPKGEGKKFLEIGCAPGSWMAYFNREFSYEVYGVENAKEAFEIAKKNLTILGVKGNLVNEDVMKTSLEKENFDVVFSHGFIEHFSNPDAAIKTHLNLLKKGGILILDVPNLRYFNYFFQKWLNKEALRGHNLKTMNLSYFNEDVIQKYGLKKIFLGYLGGFYSFLFAFKKNEPRLWNIFRRIVDKVFKFLPHFESKYFSAYIFLIAQK